MDTWLRTCLLLCLYGFFKELRPSEPFLTEYLKQPPMNLTDDELTYEVYPVWTYSYLSLLVGVFLLTDLLRYKPVIVAEGIGYVITWSLLLWARGVPAMQFMEFMYGIATSTEVAYYTYIYAKVAGKFYQRVTSYTRAAILTGRFLSAVLSQVLTHTGAMSYHDLNYVSLASVSVAFILACLLPSVSTSVYFHRQQYYVPTSEGNSTIQLSPVHQGQDGSGDGAGGGAVGGAGTGESWMAKFKKVLTLMMDDFKVAYSNKYLLKWSVWWAFATCGNFQVGNYIQPLWEQVLPVEKGETLYNGAVEATQTLLSALSAFGVGYVHLKLGAAGGGDAGGDLHPGRGVAGGDGPQLQHHSFLQQLHRLPGLLPSPHHHRQLPGGQEPAGGQLWPGVWDQYVHVTTAAVAPHADCGTGVAAVATHSVHRVWCVLPGTGITIPDTLHTIPESHGVCWDTGGWHVGAAAHHTPSGGATGVC
ncbi:hypothetical protein O3P69_002552 [Scylla paramamosain]|uniref:Thiamine transporter 1 n=1 Tax=Scylla paramamosain TaxID=85552 RepID=A0AAW0UMC2_SCYPA